MIPPAATTGIETLSKILISNWSNLISSSIFSWLKTPLWPPASMPYVTMKSAPIFSILFASVILVAVIPTLMPNDWVFLIIFFDGIPKWNVIIEGRFFKVASIWDSKSK